MISFLLMSIQLFAQHGWQSPYYPIDYIAEDTYNIRTENLKGKVKSTRTIEYDKKGDVIGLEIKQYDNKGNLIQCTYHIDPLSENGGYLSNLSLYNYDDDGRIIGVFIHDKRIGEYCYYTVKYDVKGMPVAITWYDMGEFKYQDSDANAIKPKEVFENLDNKIIQGHMTYLYNNLGKLIVSQGWWAQSNGDDRHLFEYDKDGKLIVESAFWYESNGTEKQHIRKIYYLYDKSATIKIKASDNVVEDLYYYDSIFDQTEGLKKIQNTTEISCYFRDYNKKNSNIIVDQKNLSNIVLYAQSVADTAELVKYYKESLHYDYNEHCIRKENTQRIGRTKEEKWTNYEYNIQGDKTKRESDHGWYEFWENYQYDNHGNWIQYEYYANKEHELMWTCKRTINYYE